MISLHEDAGQWLRVVVTDDGGGNQIVRLERLSGISGSSCEVYNVTTNGIKAELAIIVWKTTSKVRSCVVYDTVAHDDADDYSFRSYGVICRPNDENMVLLNGLQPAKRYHFRVVAETDAGQCAISEDMEFTTQKSDGGHHGWMWRWMWGRGIDG